VSERCAGSSFADVDEWQLDPYIENEATGQRLRMGDEGEEVSEPSESESDDHGIDEAKPFTAKVEEDAEDSGFEGMV
jgi:hypothetical protein